MKPVDYRNETFESLQDRLQGLRVDVLNAWREHGPCTTRELARKSGIDLLTLRPRTTELYQLGFVVLTNDEPENKHEGVYRALEDWEARRHFAARQAAHRPETQPEFNL